MSGRMNARPDEVIEHGRVTLRRYRTDDLDAMVQAVTDNRMTPTPSQTLMWLAIGLAFGLRARCRDQAVRA